ncbi:MAG: ATP-grasp domain-containing protein [Clostridiaceae bacterium]|nr:ATP-grasp domain-containing protein [Clostridiaceae bacterium]
MEDLAKPDSEPPLRVGLTYNLKKNIQSDVPDIEAEYDHIETVQAIQRALEKGGHEVVLLEADEGLPVRLCDQPVDIVFNIAEGIRGRGREAQVPAILNFYGIPYTGSDETTLCIALDKALTKRLLSTYHIRTPKYQVITANQAIRGSGFSFPSIVKPNAEGSSKGISDVAIVEDRQALQKMVSEHIRLYQQDMLVEEYIGGREFTVGILGNGPAARVFPPMEIIYLKQDNPYQIYSYQVKQNYKALIQYQCPAVLEQGIEHEMISAARKIYDILACKDFARMDFRLSPDGRLYFIEINPLPGLAPDYSDYPMIAAFNGLDYSSLVCGILDSALRRYGLLDDPALG